MINQTLVSEIPKGRRFYLEIAKVEMAKPNPNMKKVIMYAKNFGKVLNKDSKKIIGRCGNSDQEKHL